MAPTKIADMNRLYENTLIHHSDSNTQSGPIHKCKSANEPQAVCACLATGRTCMLGHRP